MRTEPHAVAAGLMLLVLAACAGEPPPPTEAEIRAEWEAMAVPVANHCAALGFFAPDIEPRAAAGCLEAVAEALLMRKHGEQRARQFGARIPHGADQGVRAMDECAASGIFANDRRFYPCVSARMHAR